MKFDSSKLLLSTVLITFVLLTAWVGYKKFHIYRTVAAACTQYAGEEQWVECAATVALQKNDAAYCWAGGLFSPFTGMCMSDFAEKTDERAACKTIFKPKYRNKCRLRFD